MEEQARGINHVSEIADADPPHTLRGRPFQAWSVGEALRLVHDVLDGPAQPRPAPPAEDSTEAYRKRRPSHART